MNQSLPSFWNKQRTIRTMIPLPCMILLLISRQLMSHMTLISRFQRMRILHCIRQWMAASGSTLDVMCTEDEYNRLPLVSYRSETNHWLVFYLGAKQTNEAVSDSDTEDAVRETESAAESLEGKTELEIDESPSASEDVKKHSASKTESETTKPSQQTTKPSQQTTKETESTKVPDTKPATPSTVAPTTSTPTTSPSTTAPTKVPETQPQTTAHTHAWVPVTSVVHHDATYKTVWVQDLQHGTRQ